MKITDLSIPVVFDTETIDRLFLELSQFTKATTGKEIKLEQERDRLKAELEARTENLSIMRSQRDALKAELGESRQAGASLRAENGRLIGKLEALKPFVLEDYFPDCATPEFKAAVENAYKERV